MQRDCISLSRYQYNTTDRGFEERISIVGCTSWEYRIANPHDTFDIIILSMVLQHVARAACHRILSDVRHLLKPDAQAIIATTHTIEERFSFEHDHASRTAEEFDKYASDTANQQFGIPVREFSRSSFWHEIESAGLAVIEWSQFSFVQPDKSEWFSHLLRVSPQALRDMGIGQYAIVRRAHGPASRHAPEL